MKNLRSAWLSPSGIPKPVGCFVLLATLVAVVEAWAAPERPHIVLIMADDMGWGETGYAGHPFLRTPALDAMAAAGMRCDRFYAGSPLCSPTRAAVLTGRSPDRTGVMSHGYPLRLQERSVASALQASGYRTAHFGKWHLNGVRGPGVPIRADDPRGPGRFGFGEWLSTTNYCDLDPLLSRRGATEAFEGDSSDVLVEAAVDFLRRHKDEGRPLFAAIWFGSPHSPFRALEDDRREFAGLDEASANHYGEIVAIDRSVGRLRAELRELGMARDTLLVFCSDNGGLKDIAGGTVGGLRGFKGSLYEGGIRVPGILEWPAVIRPRINRAPVCAMDLAVTMVDVAGLPAESLVEPVDGISLRAMFGDHGPRGRPIGFRYRRQRAWIDDSFKLHSGDVDEGRFSLFDLATDPGETRDRYDDLPDVAARLREQFEAWDSSVDASLAGHDYPERAVVPPDPEPEEWREAPAYESFRRTWAERPEYRRYLRRTSQSRTAAVRSAGGRRPNLVLIMADDLGYETLGCNGGESYATPRLDALATEGARFTRCFAQPLCTPTRVQLMTGLSNVRNYLEFRRIDPASITFANLLREAGYATCVAGKWQLGNDPALPERLGFDEACLWQHMRKPPRYANPGLDIDGVPHDYNDGSYGPDRVNAHVLDFMGRMRDRPFLVYYPMILTHSPYQPTPSSSEWNPTASDEKRSNPRFFADMVERMDALVGRVVDRLEELGLRDDTLVVFLGDNGTGREITSRFQGRDVPGGKGKTTAAGMHVPLVVNWPGRVPAGQVVDGLVDTTDFLPTLLDAAGVPTTLPCDGHSFLPQAEGRAGRPREWIYAWYSPRLRDRSVTEFAFDDSYKLYRDGRLFDLRDDPLEKSPLDPAAVAGPAAEAVGKLTLALDRFTDARPPELDAEGPP